MQTSKSKNSGKNAEANDRSKKEINNLLVDYSCDLKGEYINNITPITLLCACGLEFSVLPGNYKNKCKKRSADGYGEVSGRCKKCVNDVKLKKRMSPYDVIKQEVESGKHLSGYKMLTPQEEYLGSQKKFAVQCPKNHVWNVTISDFKRVNPNGKKRQCPQCSKKTRTNPRSKSELKKIIHDATSHHDLISIKMHTANLQSARVSLFCTVHEVAFSQNADSYVQGHEGCNGCKTLPTKKLGIDVIKKRIIERHGPDAFDLSRILEGANVLDKCDVTCLKCSCVFRPRLNDFYRYSSCPDCSVESKRLGIEGVRQAVAKRNIQGYEYPDQEYVNNRTPIDIICQTCTRIFKCSASNHFSGSGCVYCAASGGEQKILEILERIKMPFEFQKPVDHGGERPYEFDFYLSKLHAYIEFDGIQHFVSVKMFGGDERFQAQKISDEFKNNYCRGKYPFLRVPFYQEKNMVRIIKTFLMDLKLLYQTLPEELLKEFPESGIRIGRCTDKLAANYAIMQELQESGSETVENWLNLYSKYLLPDFDKYWKIGAKK
jgi:hypothetical protein